MKKKWNILAQNTDEKRQLAEELDTSLILAHLLLNRGIKTHEQGRLFLHPKLTDLHDPYIFADMEKAAARVKDAVLTGEKVLIYGDYDVDGITATALLYHFFKLMGADVNYYIPHRIKEGYSLHVKAVDEAAQAGITLLISVDCGITNLPEVEYAAGRGMDIIITDHHEPGKVLPKAFAILDAKLEGSRYPFRDLAGVGVSFKLAWAVAQAFSSTRKVSPDMRDFLVKSLAFVALGTIADVVPLLGENRIFARFGLTHLGESANPGIRSLMDVSGVSTEQVAARDVAFRLAPRLNAAGRMGRSHLGIDLLITDSTQRAAEIASELDKENQRRQKVEREILENARLLIKQSVDFKRDRAIVLSSDNWHAGVIGIVASRLVEEHFRPVVLISIEDGKGKGSARSIPGLPLHEVLAECGGCLTTFGGHARAAGLEVPPENIEEFSGLFMQKVNQRLKHKDLRPELDIDMEVLFSALTYSFVQELAQLRPHGERNPPPLLATYGVRVVGKPRVVGKDGRHLSFYARQGELTMKAIAFDKAHVLPEIQRNNNTCAIAYRPVISNWQGRESVELDIKDFLFE
jgi:single-stranded-DNA-specific exonuclease